MEDRSDHLVLGGLLFLVFSLVVALVFVYTRAADTGTGQSPTTSAVIANEAPTVDTVVIQYTDTNNTSLTEIDLAIGGQKAVVVHGVVSDNNGTALDGANALGDLKDVEVVLRRSGATNSNSCTADNNDCYRASFVANGANPNACTITSTGATTAKYVCSYLMEYFADGTLNDGGEFAAENWVAEVEVTDLSDATGTANATSEVKGLLALDVPTEIAYGQFTLGATTTAATTEAAGTNRVKKIQQKGNVIGSVTVQGSGTGPRANGVMVCDALGTIPVANQKWATSSVAYGSAIALTASGVDTNLSVQYQKNDNFASNPSYKDLFWHIGIPTTGVRGTCDGVNTISVIAGS